MNYVICFDIGGTNVKYGIINIENKIVEKGHFKSDINCGQKIKDQMCELIESFLERYSVVGITFSSPGFVNIKTGVIESGTTLEGFTGFAIKDYFEEKFNLPVTVENDANCATIAEHVLGNGKGYENIACLTVGTGIGGGIIINNQIYSGSNFMAGEFGFMILEQNDNKEIGSNTFSRLASTSSLIKRTRQDLNQEIDGVQIFTQAKLGDEICQKNIEIFYDYLAQGIYNVCYVLNPQKVLIGGAVSEQLNLIEEITKRLDSYTQDFSVPLTTYTTFDRCYFLNDAGLMGSYCNFMNQYAK